MSAATVPGCGVPSAPQRYGRLLRRGGLNPADEAVAIAHLPGLLEMRASSDEVAGRDGVTRGIKGAPVTDRIRAAAVVICDRSAESSVGNAQRCGKVRTTRRCERGRRSCRHATLRPGRPPSSSRPTRPLPRRRSWPLPRPAAPGWRIALASSTAANETSSQRAPSRAASPDPLVPDESQRSRHLRTAARFHPDALPGTRHILATAPRSPGARR
jgi:hypothetical protein